MSRVGEWEADNCRRRWISDTSSATRISATGLYSLQNGLLLSSFLHQSWDLFGVDVDPDVRLLPLPHGLLICSLLLLSTSQIYHYTETNALNVYTQEDFEIINFGGGEDGG